MKRHRDHASGRILLTLVLGLATGLWSGCATSAANQTSPPTATLTASPTTIAAGTSATLTWTSANAASASINNGVGSVPLARELAELPLPQVLRDRAAATIAEWVTAQRQNRFAEIFEESARGFRILRDAMVESAKRLMN